DYYALRVLGHFLLHCQSGLKVAQVARLLGISRPTASRQQALSAKQAIQQAHHRLDGRPYGKLLPRYAGPIAEFLFRHPDASRPPEAGRAPLTAFAVQPWGAPSPRTPLYMFQKMLGRAAPPRRAAGPPPAASAAPAEAAGPRRREGPAGVPVVGTGQPVPTPA